MLRSRLLLVHGFHPPSSSSPLSSSLLLLANSSLSIFSPHFSSLSLSLCSFSQSMAAHQEAHSSDSHTTKQTEQQVRNVYSLIPRLVCMGMRLVHVHNVSSSLSLSLSLSPSHSLPLSPSSFSPSFLPPFPPSLSYFLPSSLSFLLPSFPILFPSLS